MAGEHSRGRGPGWLGRVAALVAGAPDPATAAGAGAGAGQEGAPGGSGSQGAAGGAVQGRADVRSGSDRPPGPSVAFDEVGEEATLARLWDAVETARQQEVGGREAFTAFLEAYLAQFKDWQPRERDLGAEGGGRSALGCVEGHPDRVIASLVGELGRLGRGLPAFLGNPGAWEDLDRVRREALGLEVLSILMRSPHNRRLFAWYGGFRALVSLTRLIAANLAECAAYPDEGVAEKSGLLGRLLVHMALTVSTFVDAGLWSSASSGGEVGPTFEKPGGAFLRFGRPRSLSRQVRGQTSSVGVGSARHPQADLMETGIFDAFLDVLKANLRIREHIGQIAILQTVDELILLAIQTASASSTALQDHLRDIGGVELLLEFIGAPSLLRGFDDALAESVGGSQTTTVQPARSAAEELKIQCLALATVFDSARANAYSLQRITAGGGLERISRMLVWASRNFFEENPTTSEKCSPPRVITRADEVPPGCVGLQQVFSLFGEQLAYGYDGPGESLVLLCLRALLEPFQGVDGPSPSWTGVSARGDALYQHYVVQWIAKLLRVVPAGLNACRKRGAWDVLCGEYFYGFAFSEREGVGGTPRESRLALQQRILALFDLAINLENSHENVQECSKLVELLEVHMLRPTGVIPISGAIKRALAGSRRPYTVDSLYRCGFTARLANIILKQRSDAWETQGGDEAMLELMGTPGLSDPRNQAVAARLELIGLLREILGASESIRRQVIREWTVAGALFSTMWDAEVQNLSLDLILDLMCQKTMGDDERLAKSVLFTRYLEALPRAQSERSTSGVKLVLRLLSGIQRVMKEDAGEHQSMFLDAEALLQVSNLLNEDYGPMEGSEVCCQVLETLTALMAGNFEAREKFELLMGRETLLHLVVQSAGQHGPLPFGVVKGLLGLATDGSILSEGGSSAVTNSGIMPVIVDALQLVVPEFKSTGLRMIHELLKGHIAYCCACCGLATQLLQWFGKESDPALRNEIGDVIQLIGSVSITATDLRLIFNMFRAPDEHGLSHGCRSHLLRILQNMADHDGPSSFFDFSGQNSGMELISPLRSRIGKGYAIVFWMRHGGNQGVPSDSASEAVFEVCGRSNSGEARSMSIVHSGGRFWSAVFDTKAHTATFRPCTTRGQWHQIAFVHTNGGPFTHSQMALYVDSRLVDTQKLSFVKGMEVITSLRIGVASEPESRDQRALVPAFTPAMAAPFLGQIGTVWMFHEPLGAKQVEQLHALGPQHSSPFFPSRSGLDEAVLLGFNAQASSQGEKVYNIAETTSGEAELCPGTQLCCTRSMSDILYCIGGVSILLPLLQPGGPSAEEVLRLFSRVLNGGPGHMRAMYQTSGFALINYLLKQRQETESLAGSNAWMTVSLLDSVKVLLEAVRDHPELLREAESRLLLDIRFWSSAPEETQREYFSLLRTSKGQKSMAEGSLTLPVVLDSVRAHSSDADGPKEPNLAILREGALSLLPQLLSRVGTDSILAEAGIQAILALMVDGPGEGIITDSLSAFSSALAMDASGQLLDSCQRLGGTQLFLGAIGHRHEPLRLNALCLMSALAGKGDSSSGALWESAADSLCMYPLSSETSGTLLAAVTLPPGLLPQVVSDSVDADLAKGVENPWALVALLKVAAGSEPVASSAAMSGVLAALSADTSKCGKIFDALSGGLWQELLAPLVMSERARDDDAAAKCARILLGEALRSVEGGWVHLERFGDALLAAAVECGSGTVCGSPETVLSDILAGCMEDLHIDAVSRASSTTGKDTGPGDWEDMDMPLAALPPLRRNLCRTLVLLEEALLGGFRSRGGGSDDSGEAEALAWAEDAVRGADPPAPPLGAQGILGLSPESGAWKPSWRLCTAAVRAILILRTALAAANDSPLPSVCQMELTMAQESGAPTVREESPARRGLGAAAAVMSAMAVAAATNLVATEDFGEETLSDAAELPLRILLLVLPHAALGEDSVRSAPVSHRGGVPEAVQASLSEVTPESVAASAGTLLAACAPALAGKGPGTAAMAAAGGSGWASPAARGRLALCLAALHNFQGEKGLQCRQAAKAAAMSLGMSTSESAGGTAGGFGSVDLVEVAMGARADLEKRARVRQRRAVRAATWRSERGTAEKTSAAERRKFQEMGRAGLAALSGLDRSRRQTAFLARKAESRELERLWRKMLRTASDPRAVGQVFPSGRAEDAQGSQEGTKWRVDPTEDPARRRQRLRRDWQPCDYESEDAARESAAQGQRLSRQGSAALPVVPRGALVRMPNESDMAEEGHDTAGNLSGAEDANSSGDADLSGEVEEQLGLAGEEAETADVPWESSMAALQEIAAGGQKILLRCPCELVAAKAVFPGTLYLTPQRLHFLGSQDEEDAGKESRVKVKVWSLREVEQIHVARYMLQRRALEMFLSDRRNYLLAFETEASAREMATRICSSPLAGRSVTLIDRTKKSEHAEKLALRWRRREISNFEYLMALNTLAGRSYNDLSQYPVFPWVLSDYTSETLDLRSPAVYRDLSKPMGALVAGQREFFVERYNASQEADPDTPAFHYGSHYSSAGAITYYLIRMEPFTKLHRQLQGGRFDHADRLFHSVASTWHNCSHSSSDVKELIPEFYYMPEFLRNANELRMGTRQDGMALGDVVLPPWAQDSPERFVHLMREALESDYVSAHLHEWVDLVFGFKQQGKAAEQAVNVFHYLTYEGAVDLDAIDDEHERKAVQDQIMFFGQTPSRLFPRAQAERGAPSPTFNSALASPKKATKVVVTRPSANPGMSKCPVLHIGLHHSRIVTVNCDGTLSVHRWITPKSEFGSFTFSPAAMDLAYGVDIDAHPKTLGSVAALRNNSDWKASFASVGGGKLLLSTGHWDNSLRLTSTEGKVLQSLATHKDRVTSLAVCGQWGPVVTASHDTTVMVWDLLQTTTRTKSKLRVAEQPRHVLYGHTGRVACLAASADVGVVASGSDDGMLLLHDLRKGEVVRGIQVPEGGSEITHLVMSAAGDIIAHSHADLSLQNFTVNGTLVAAVETSERLRTLSLSPGDRYLVTGGDMGILNVWNPHDLSVYRRIDCSHGPITSALCTPEGCILAGTADGHLMSYVPDLAKTTQRPARKSVDAEQHYLLRK